MNKALLDTDIFSEILKGQNVKVQQNAAAYRQAFGVFTLSVVTVMELVKGLHKVRREADVQAILAHIATEDVIDVDLAAAERAGRIHADLERTGQTIGWGDTVIAAIALQNGLELVTGNTAHYQRLGQFGYPLTLRNWRA